MCDAKKKPKPFQKDTGTKLDSDGDIAEASVLVLDDRQSSQSLKDLLVCLVNDLQGCQQELFRQMSKQHIQFQNQLLEIQSVFEASADAQTSLKQQHESFLAELHSLISTPKVPASAQNVQAADVADHPAGWMGDKMLASVRNEISVGAPQLAVVPTETLPNASKSFWWPHAPEPEEVESTPIQCKTDNDLSPSGWMSAENSEAAAPTGSATLADSGTFQVRHSTNSAKMSNEFFGLPTDEEVEWGSGLRGRIDKLLNSKEFELAIAFAIMLNAFIMCWECQYQGLEVGFNLQYPGRPEEANNTWTGAQMAFVSLEWFFGSIFLLEMIVKLACWRFKYFYLSKDRDSCGGANSPFQQNSYGCEQYCFCFRNLQIWNLLDCFCVVAFLFSKVAAFGLLNPQTLRLLRLFRLGRLVRLLRFLESLDHLYVMTTAISGLKQVLLWAIVLLTTMLLACDLFLVQILQVTYFDQVRASDLTEDQLRSYHQIYEYFGTWTRCMLSMFEITLGNWPPVARLLSEEISEWFALLCILHKLFIGFAVVGVITGVILQETFKVAQTDDLIMFRQKKAAEKTLKKKLFSLFHALDKSGDGLLELDEIESISELPDIKAWLHSLGIETGDLKTLFSLIDVDGSGYVTYDDMVARIPRIQGHARSLDVLAIHRYLYSQGDATSERPTTSPTNRSSFTDNYFPYILTSPHSPAARSESRAKTK